jgi:catechol 2,3-dioxygenase-like lactoylglutathione lyase family enzyme
VLPHQQNDERSADTGVDRTTRQLEPICFQLPDVANRLPCSGRSRKEPIMTQLEEEIVTGSGAARMDMKLEVVVIPVSDVDRAKEFYARLGWRLDADFESDNGFRIVQLTPPGSGASVQFGTKVTTAAPGSAQNSYLVVSDILATREQLVARGVAVSEVFHTGEPGSNFEADGSSGRLPGLAPDRTSYRSYATFADPDGNRWMLQEVTTRLAGRVEAVATEFASVNDLASALRRAAAAHGEHEQRIGQHDANWPDWYATHMVAEQNGQTLPQ